MANQHILFQPSMSIPEFLRCFGTEVQRTVAVKLARWPDGFRCPRCSPTEHCVVGHGGRKLSQFNGCRHQTSLTAGSLMVHNKLPLTTWFLAIYLVSQAETGLSALALKRQLGVSYPTAKHGRFISDSTAPWPSRTATIASAAPCSWKRLSGRRTCRRQSRTRFRK